jgi:hypothetical protein
LKHQSPIQALKNWQTERPELFVKQVYKQPGLDIYELGARGIRDA